MEKIKEIDNAKEWRKLAAKVNEILALRAEIERFHNQKPHVVNPCYASTMEVK